MAIININEIQKAFEKLKANIKKNAGKDYDGAVTVWIMAATIRIWSANILCAEEYTEALSVFGGEKISTAAIMTALDCAGAGSSRMVIPEFFKEIVENDIKNGTAGSRFITDDIGHFLAMMALVNGDFTIQEAGNLKQITDQLYDCCDRNHIYQTSDRVSYMDQVTPINKTGYFREADSKSTPDKEENEIMFNVTVSLDTTDLPTESQPKQYTDIQPPAISDKSAAHENVSISKPTASADSEETLDSILAELNELVGLDKVKKDVQSLLNFIKICQLRTQRGMKVPTISYHLVFTGNPGTGKTTVARLVAKLYYHMGILPKGQLVETDRSGLVAGYLGQTAIKTQQVIQQALGGVLFIDEAYSLANDKEDSYGKEAIETILKAMEDHRSELVIIVAGYDDLMRKFIDSNPGLRSRFNKYFNFPDYNGQELLQILENFCDTNGYTLAAETLQPLSTKFDEMYLNREVHFGNARAVRNLFEHAINNQADRLVLDESITDEELAELTLADIKTAMEEI